MNSPGSRADVLALRSHLLSASALVGAVLIGIHVQRSVDNLPAALAAGAVTFASLRLLLELAFLGTE